MDVTLITNIKGENKRSMEIYATCLKNALERHSDDLNVDQIAPLASFSFIRSRRLRKLINPFDQIIGYILKLGKISGDENKIYHITDHVYSYLLMKLPPKRTIVTCHDITPLIANEFRLGAKKISLKSFWHFKLKVKMIAKAAQVIAVSESTRNDLIRHNICQPEKISVVYSGIPNTYLPMSNIDRIQLRKSMDITDEILLLHVGGSVFYKTIEGIIGALKILCASNFEKKFVFIKAGEPFTIEQIRMIEDYGLVNFVRYIGSPKTSEAMREIYNISDMLLFPSLYEGFGWPPIEAMSCGIPVISSDKGSLKEVVGDAALICDPHSPASMAEQVLKLVKDDLLRNSLIERGILRSHLFSWDETAKNVINIYKKIAREIKS